MLGGMHVWGPTGTLQSSLDMTPIDTTDLKPLFAQENGGGLILFEAGLPTNFYFFSLPSSSVQQINPGFGSLEDIVKTLGESEDGYQAIPTIRLN
jgi:hypothetical protein